MTDKQIEALGGHPWDSSRLEVTLNDKERQVSITFQFRTLAAAQVYFETITGLLNAGKDVALTLDAPRRIHDEEKGRSG